MTRKELRNLILLTVDAWRWDFARMYPEIQVLPSLAHAGPHSAQFERFYANVPWTTPALVSILTGESPARHRVHYQWSIPREGGPALARMLGEAGYALPNLCYLNGINGYQNLGFDPREAPGASPLPRDESLLMALREFCRKGTPFFLWYHYKHLHLPYWPEERHRRRMGIDGASIPQRLRDSICSQFVVPREQYPLLDEDRDLARRLYGAGLLQLEEFLQPLLEELHAGDLLEHTTFVLTADHGEELLDHGHVGHASTSFNATLHEEVLHIPLFVLDGRIQGHRLIHGRMQGMDLHSTMLSLVGLDAPLSPGAFDFSSHILDAQAPLPPDDRWFYFHSARMGFRTPREKADQTVEGVSNGRRKIICEHFDRNRTFGFDLDADPGEQRALESTEEVRDPAFPASSLARVRSALE